MENINSRQSKLVKSLKQAGITLIGFGDISATGKKFAMFPVAISLIINYENEEIENLDKDPRSFQSKRAQIYENFKKAIEIAVEIMTNWGYETFVPSCDPGVQCLKTLSNDFSHKTAATTAGLGWIGKSSLLINPKYGPRIRLATILTNAPFQTASPLVKDGCGGCKLCVDACPFNAIKGASWFLDIKREELVDVDICYEKGPNMLNEDGQKYRCGKCLQVCKIGK